MVRWRQIRSSGQQTPSQTVTRLKACLPSALCTQGNICRSYPANPQATLQPNRLRKKDLQQENIATVYAFPSSMQRCLMMGATVALLHEAMSQTLCLVGFSPVLP